MSRSNPVSKRVRPLLGTFVEVSIFSGSNADASITRAFENGVLLEKIFNVHDPESEISLLNNSVGDDSFELSRPLAELIRQAQYFFEISEGAFNPWQEGSDCWDLSGIAKGYIVDKMVENLLEPHRNSEQNSSQELKGLVNAGGDLRFFNYADKEVTLRLGSPQNPLLRKIVPQKNAVATSSPSVSLTVQGSSTRYLKPLRAGLDVYHSVVAIADTCATADALTKVGLFAKPQIIQKCASSFDAQVIIFDEMGQAVEVFE